MVAFAKRWKIQAEDALKNSPLVRGALSRCKLWTIPGATRDQQTLARSIKKLCAAARFATSDDAVRAIQGQIHKRLQALEPKKVDWSPFAANSNDFRIPRGVLLKPWLGPQEKGVLFVSFETEWFRLLAQCDLKDFSERYYLVIAPSGSPHNLLNYVFAAAFPGKLFTLISNAGDQEVLPRVATNFVVVPLYASHWVLPDLFVPRPWQERDLDLVMVANFAKFKRHYALFGALRQMDRRLRILLVGQDQDDRTAESIRQEAACYGVADQVEIQRNVKYPGVAEALSRARASVILSRREGSCVVVAESLFANTPVAILQSAEIGSRAFINPETGLFLDSSNLAAQLTQFIERAHTFSPRPWALANISCLRSTQTLNAILRDHALKEGQDWTRDIATLCWRPDPALVHKADVQGMQQARHDFKERFGLEVGPPPDRVE
jgi:glycosyltransferase involved in cell wall biosynthesis